jgi:aminomethyltransferase
MAYVTKENAAEGSEVYIMVRDKALKAKVVKMPFA